MKQDTVEFRPIEWRCVLSRLLFVLIAAPLGSALGYLLLGRPSLLSWVGSTLGYIAGFALVIVLFSARSLQDQLTIVISDGQIAGPSLSGLKRVCFSLRRLDKRKTARQSRLARVTGERYIWSRDGDKIRLDCFAFGPAQVEAIMARLGCVEHASSYAQASLDGGTS